MKNWIKFSAMFIGLIMAFSLVSCGDDDGGGTTTPANNTKPVLNETFTFVVSGNDVTFSTTLTGNVWFTKDGVTYPTVDKAVTVKIALKGDYIFTCSAIVDGVTVTSEEFTVSIAQDDVSIYAAEEWINLTGGFNQSKGWVLDVKGKIHEGPLSFLGTSWDFVAAENANEDDAWMWDAAADWTFSNAAMLDPEPDGYGVMYFNLIDGMNFIADKEKEDSETGSFIMDYDTRTITLNGATILRSYKPDANTAEEGEDPILVDGMEGISDWYNYKIYDLSENVLRLAVKRDQDVQDEGACWLVYNFISKAYDDANEVVEATVDDWPNQLVPVTTNVTTESDKFDGIWKIVQNETWASWYPGFWNFSTGTNDYPSEYVGTTVEGDVTWDPYIPPTDGSATWAMPSDSLKQVTFVFDKTDLTLKIFDDEGLEAMSGSYTTDGSLLTTGGDTYVLANDDDRNFDMTTSIIAELTDTSLKLAFYQNDGSKNQYVVYTLEKQTE